MVFTPGQRFEQNGNEFFACAVANDQRETVTLSSLIVTEVQKENGITEILWPAGAFVYFTPEGMIICVFGTNAAKDHVIGKKLFPVAELKADEGLAASWEKFKSTPRNVVSRGIQSLVQASAKTPDMEIVDMAKVFFEYEKMHVEVAARIWGIEPARVTALASVDGDDIVVKLFRDEVLVPSDSPEVQPIHEHFAKILEDEARAMEEEAKAAPN
jgi:hypothetical protein